MFTRKKHKKILADPNSGPVTLLWEGGYPNQEFDELVQPMSRHTPEWYKQTQRWVEINGEKLPGLKHCMPFLDALGTGYGVFLAEDVWVEEVEGKVIVSHNNQQRGPVSNREPAITNPAPHPPGYYEEHFIWSLSVSIRIPDGYSCLFTHPLNRWDLPFISTSAIVDDYNCPGANMAFHLKIGFIGKIPAGTMVAQLIPFRREEWVAKESMDGELMRTAHWNTVKNEELQDGYYRKNHWKKKIYR